MAFDLDGTLLRSDKRVSERTLAAMRALAARGVRLVICTGRPPRHAMAVAGNLGLAQPFICFNGAASFDAARGRLTVHRRLDPAVAAEAVRRLRRAVPGVLLGLESEHGWYLDEGLLAARRSGARLGREEPTGVGDIERFLDADALKVLAEHESVSAEAMAAHLRGLALHRTWSTRSLLELLHPEVNKRAGLEALCERLGLAAADVAAFGDQHNDVEMLAWAGRGYAMGNASAEAIAAADEVIGSNDEDGVANVLEGWIAASDAAGSETAGSEAAGSNGPRGPNGPGAGRA